MIERDVLVTFVILSFTLLCYVVILWRRIERLWQEKQDYQTWCRSWRERYECLEASKEKHTLPAYQQRVVDLYTSGIITRDEARKSLHVGSGEVA